MESNPLDGKKKMREYMKYSFSKKKAEDGGGRAGHDNLSLIQYFFFVFLILKDADLSFFRTWVSFLFSYLPTKLLSAFSPFSVLP